MASRPPHTRTGPQTGPSGQAANRQFVKYTFFKVASAWRGLPADERAAMKQEIVDILEAFAERMLLRVYSTVGTRGDCDLMLWTVSDRLEDFQELTARLFGSGLGVYLEMPYSYLAMTKESVYSDERQPLAPREGSERKYLIVYPMWKKREWYALPGEERMRIMRSHIETGRRYGTIEINTAYSFGLDDQEFVVSFNTDSPSDFLDLVHELRATESSAWTESETPIFTCITASVERALGALDGQVVAVPA